MSITAPILKLLAAGIIAVGIGAAALGAEDDARQITAAGIDGSRDVGRGTIGGPFSLTDHTGRPRTDADFRGKLLLVYFGFTHCPDICPTDLMGVAGALNSLGAQADEVRALFISLDPQRDTQALLSTYVEFVPSTISLALPATNSPSGAPRTPTRSISRKCPGRIPTITASITPPIFI